MWDINFTITKLVAMKPRIANVCELLQSCLVFLRLPFVSFPSVSISGKHLYELRSDENLLGEQKEGKKIANAAALLSGYCDHSPLAEEEWDIVRVVSTPLRPNHK
jgi:hypothetical protein